MKRAGVLAFVALLCAAAAHAEQYACMRAGTRVRIERYETAGAATRLFLPGGGSVDVQTEAIAGFEADEYTPATPAPPAPRMPPPAPPPAGLKQIVRDSGDRHGLDPDLIHSVIRAESGGNTRAVSPKGARGLMQLMPQTARELSVSDVFDPVQNVEGGTRYLRQLLALYGNDLALALAAYNAGPHKVAAHRGLPPYRETREYVTRVIRDFNQRKTAGLGQ